MKLVKARSRALIDRVRPGPRYTSYPPATRFSPDFAAADAAAELARVGQAGEPIGLYLHVPFCRSLCWYCACNVVITRNRDRGAAYVYDMVDELELIARAMGTTPPVGTLALGGGSPNFLATGDMRRLLAAVRERFELARDATLGVELAPTDTTDEQIATLAELGFRRLSVGVQDFDPEVQETIHRIQTPAQTRHLIGRARAAGFTEVNVDLVYGLPGQSPVTVADTLDEVLTMRPDQVAVFGYAHLPDQRPHQRLVERRGPVPDVAHRADLAATVRNHLEAADYLAVGIDHFARPGSPLARAAEQGAVRRGFQGYVAGGPRATIGCGLTAISDTGAAYWQNAGALDAWRAQVGAGALPIGRGLRLSADDRLRRAVIMDLMCRFRVDVRRIEREFDIDFAQAFADELAELRQGECADLVDIDLDGGVLEMNDSGRPLVRNVCMVFDAHLRAAAERTTYSLTL